MIDVLTPMKDGKTIALQSDDYSSPQVERLITGGPKFRKGMRVTRTRLARKQLRDLGLESVTRMEGTVTGKARGKFAGCVLVRVDGDKTAYPFKPELWQPDAAARRESTMRKTKQVAKSIPAARRPTICYPARAPELKFDDWFYEYATKSIVNREELTEKQWARVAWNAAVEAAAYTVGTDGNFIPQNEYELECERTRRELELLVRETLTAE